ncbi:MAG: hypothetical protein K0Q91_1474 [Fibrobacteria bacterium]|nr:hypothetical protein [Fibrobacteria bacterium]
MTRFFIAILIAASCAAAQGLNTEAANLLARARANLLAADRAVDVLCVRDSYLRGRDTLRGWMDFRDARGERRLSLSGGGESFEWWSRHHGAEQWRRDDATERLRRIPPHSLKKPALAAVPLSYEDLLRFPLGYFDRFVACKRLQETDSTYELTLSLSPLASSRYAAAEVSLRKSPVLLRRVVFSGAGKPSKSLEIAYRMESGKHAPSDLRFEGGDGLASLRLVFTPRAAAPVQDKTWAPDAGVPSVRPRDPRLEPRDVEGVD